MQDATINSALADLRARIIRDRLPGLEHVEALLKLRRQKLAPVRRKVPRLFPRHHTRREVLRALRDGPMGLQAIAHRLHAECPAVPFWRVCGSVRGCLARFHQAGVVRNGDGTWWLASSGGLPLRD